MAQREEGRSVGLFSVCTGVGVRVSEGVDHELADFNGKVGRGSRRAVCNSKGAEFHKGFEGKLKGMGGNDRSR